MEEFVARPRILFLVVRRSSVATTGRLVATSALLLSPDDMQYFFFMSIMFNNELVASNNAREVAMLASVVLNPRLRVSEKVGSETKLLLQDAPLLLFNSFLLVLPLIKAAALPVVAGENEVSVFPMLYVAKEP